MKFRIILFLLTSLFLSKSHCQEKISIGFIPITFDEYKIESKRANIIQETIINSFVSTRRFTVVDRSQLEEIEKEKKLQRTSAFMDSKPGFKEGVSAGASFLVSTNLISTRESEVKGGWVSVTHLQIKLLDVSTGEILVTENLSSEITPIKHDIKDIKNIILTSADKAVKELKDEKLNKLQRHGDEAFMVSLQRLEENIKNFLSYNFPIPLEIVSWNQKKKDRFEIGGGYKHGLYNGQRLDVIKVTETSLGGEILLKKTVIGMAIVSKVHDENFSEAAMIDETKEFKQAKKTGAIISVLTR